MPRAHRPGSGDALIVNVLLNVIDHPLNAVCQREDLGRHLTEQLIGIEAQRGRNVSLQLPYRVFEVFVGYRHRAQRCAALDVVPAGSMRMMPPGVPSTATYSSPSGP